MTEIEKIEDQIQDFFGDKSRASAETREGLESLASTIESMLDSLGED